MKLKSDYIKILKDIKIRTIKKTDSRVESIYNFHKEMGNLFSKKQNVIFYFILKGIELEKNSIKKSQNSQNGNRDIMRRIDNYLEGRNFDTDLISMDLMFQSFQEWIFSLPIALLQDPSILILDPSTLGTIYTYFFNFGFDSIEDKEELVKESINETFLNELNININDRINMEEEQHALFVLDGSNIARNKTNSKQGDLNDIIRCRDKLNQLGVPTNKIIILIGPALRYNLNEEQKVEFEKFIKEKNVNQTPKGLNDDDFIIQVAFADDAYIITNDFYLDYIEKHPELRDFIKDHSIHYTIVSNKIVFTRDDEIRIRKICNERLK